MLRSWLNMKIYRDKNAPGGVLAGSARYNFEKMGLGNHRLPKCKPLAVYI